MDAPRNEFLLLFSISLSEATSLRRRAPSSPPRRCGFSASSDAKRQVGKKQRRPAGREAGNYVRGNSVSCSHTLNPCMTGLPSAPDRPRLACTYRARVSNTRRLCMCGACLSVHARLNSGRGERLSAGERDTHGRRKDAEGDWAKAEARMQKWKERQFRSGAQSCTRRCI